MFRTPAILSVRKEECYYTSNGKTIHRNTHDDNTHSQVPTRSYLEQNCIAIGTFPFLPVPWILIKTLMDLEPLNFENYVFSAWGISASLEPACIGIRTLMNVLPDWFWNQVISDSRTESKCNRDIKDSCANLN